MNNDPGGLPYGLTWWLDAVCPGRWSGLVLDDYRLVMPLPREPFSWRSPWRSWARPRVQRPFFTQQCGPFGTLLPHDLPRLLPPLFNGGPGGGLPFSESINEADFPVGYPLARRTNLVLDLSPPLENIRAGYHRDLRRKLRKHGPATLLPADPELVLSVYREQIAAKAGLKSKHFTRARALIKAALRNDAGYCYQLLGADEELLAVGFFPLHRGRIINLMPASTPAGYRRQGMALLLDAVIERHRGPGHLFDFEGSDIPGIASFFRAFGPELRPYLTAR